MQKVRLVGEISKFGSVWETDCSSIRDILKLIDCQTPGFRQHLAQAVDSGVDFSVQRGEDFLENAEEMLLSIGKEDIIITEIPVGAKSGQQKILAGAAFIALFILGGGAGVVAGVEGATFFGFGGKWAAVAAYGTLAVGTNLALAGVTQLLAPGPETEDQQEEGYLFNGPVNNIAQGLPVPVCYGELVVGGAPISVSFNPDLGSMDGKRRGIYRVDGAALSATYIPVQNNSIINNYDVTVPTPGPEDNVFKVVA